MVYDIIVVGAGISGLVAAYELKKRGYNINMPDTNLKDLMYTVFDTETTGLPRDWKAPVTQTNNWPRMVQLAWLQYDD